MRIYHIKPLEKSIAIFLVGVVISLQYQLWLGKNSMMSLAQLKKSVSLEEQANTRLKQRNKKILDEIDDLQNGMAAVEELARSQLGMIKKNESFFLIMPKLKQERAQKTPPLN